MFAVAILMFITIHCLLLHLGEKGSLQKHIKQWNLNTGTFQAAHPDRSRVQGSFVITLIPDMKA